MEQYIEVISVLTIVAIVYTIIEVLKQTTNKNEKFLKFVPLVSLTIGVVCGVVAFFAVPGYLETSNIVIAIVIGGASGLSATGTNQVFKQLITKVEDKEDK